jgi:hypothetical protein
MQRVAITTRNIWDDGSPVPFPVRRIPLLTWKWRLVVLLLQN